jgi:hypothetical protein
MKKIILTGLLIFTVTFSGQNLSGKAVEEARDIYPPLSAKMEVAYDIYPPLSMKQNVDIYPPFTIKTAADIYPPLSNYKYMV